VTKTVSKIAILGAGNWGTTLALLLDTRDLEIALWTKDSEMATAINKAGENTQFLPGYPLPKRIKVSENLESCVTNADIVLFVLPTPVVRSVARLLHDFLGKETILVTATKGIERNTGQRISSIISEETGSTNPIVVLSGPNIAPEIVQRMPASAVAASDCPESAEIVQRAFSTPWFRVYTNSDVIGVEYGGALKNIIAIGAGSVSGMGFGDNTKSALITRGLAEMTRFGVFFGANPFTFLGLAGLGDLVATCASPLSRNHRCGRLLAQSIPLQDIEQQIGMVAEGINTTASVYSVARENDISMPVTEELYEVLFNGRNIKTAIQNLMERTLRSEDEFSGILKQ
jgi:glycerol-3-phosphate dehydrogenase (NAD(P)+)